MKRLWTACLILIALNALTFVLPRLMEQGTSDMITLAIGAIDLIACPILIAASLKLYRKK